MTSVTAIHDKTGAKAKKCRKSGTNIYPDLPDTAQGRWMRDGVAGNAGIQHKAPLVTVVGVHPGRTCLVSWAGCMDLRGVNSMDRLTANTRGVLRNCAGPPVQL
ncbi:hypothetical protein PproGo58_56930 [Pseudomonas protegens]|nr:hypothetical protein PproGo58_56930 [Pseudomonas protegens]